MGRISVWVWVLDYIDGIEFWVSDDNGRDRNKMIDEKIIYGSCNETNIIKVEIDKDDGSIVEFIQLENGMTIENRISGYRPLIYQHDPNKSNTKGNNYYNNLNRASSIDFYYKHYKDRDVYLKQHDLTSSYLVDKGKTLFKGMSLDTIHYLGFDIETTGLDYSKARVNTKKLDYVSPASVLPKKMLHHKYKIEKYFKQKKIVSMFELEKELSDGDIHIGMYLEFWKGLLCVGLIDDVGEQVRMVSLDTREGAEIIYSKDEKEFLIKFLKRFHEIDANLIIGFNSNTFDLPFLMYRAWVHKLEFKLGRDGSEPKHKVSQLRLGVGQNNTQSNWHIYGRNWLDLYPYVMKYDFSDRKLDSFKLKNVMATYGLQDDTRLVLEFKEILAGLEAGEETEEYQKVYDYCLDDAKDLMILLKYIGQADFYLSQMIPMNYDTLCFAGNVTRVNALLLRDYVYNRTSVPRWKEFMEKDDIHVGTMVKYMNEYRKDDDIMVHKQLYEIIEKGDTYFVVKSMVTNITHKLDYKHLNMFKLNVQGAEVQADNTGIFKHVGDSDINSMYPSIMIAYDIFPETDILQSMKTTLSLLRDMRFDIKKELKSLNKNSVEYKTKYGQQLAYKLFLNSEFGALSSNGFYFKDSNKCALVTKYGREMIIVLRDKIIDMGYKITSLDTDGLSYTNGEPIDIEYMDKELDAILPEGIGIETQIYDKIIVFARKTYYAQYPNGEHVVKGAALTARSTPMFYRRFVKRMCYLLCEDDYEGIKAMYNETIRQINMGELPLDEFSTLSSINMSVDKYKKDNVEYELLHGKKKAKRQIYELAIKTGKLLKPGDKVNTYHKFEEVEKQLTPSQQKKQDTKSLMDGLFTIPKTMVKVDALAWCEDYNNDLNSEYYIKLLNNKIEKLLFKKVDNEGHTSGVLPEDVYRYIIGDSMLNEIHKYNYVDTTRIIDGYFTKWERIHMDDIHDMVLEQNTGQFVTIQQFATPEKGDNESVYHPLYFDFDSSDLEMSFNDTKIVYHYFKNVLKIEDKHIMVWFSGNKGFHIEVKPQLFKISPMPNLQLINKEIALWLIDKYKLETVDIGSLYSSRRQWRLGWSLNEKSNRYKTWIKNFDDIDDMDDILEFVDTMNVEEEIKKYFKHIKDTQSTGYRDELASWIKPYFDKYYKKISYRAIRKPKFKFEKLGNKRVKCIEMLLNQSINSSVRNRATLSIGSFLKESSVEFEEAVEILTEWTLNIPPEYTSIRGETAIRNNITSVLRTVYEGDSYVFRCEFIIPLLKDRGFKCPNNCVLAD